MKFQILKNLRKKKATIWSSKEDKIVLDNSKQKLRNKLKLGTSKLKRERAKQIYLSLKLINPELEEGRITAEEDQKLKELISSSVRS